MRKSQWIVLGIALVVITYICMIQTPSWQYACNTNNDISACVRAGVFAVFVYILPVLAIACLFNAWLEGKAEKKEVGE
jgi:sterol desaturase/sphingolipid hydroxylase (fatty acid hydroxylase superfamily)